MAHGHAPSSIPFPVEVEGVEDFTWFGLNPCEPISAFSPLDLKQWTTKLKPHELFEFAFSGDVDNGKHEIEHGADPSMQEDATGMSPLMVATQEGHLEFVEILLHAGADIHQQNLSGRTALHFAAISNRLEIAELLCTSETVNVVDNDGASVGVYCARRGHTDMLRLLCESGLHVNLKDNRGRTALMAAAQFGEIASVKVLLKHQALTDLQDATGATALLIAASFSHKDVTRCLIEVGDINICDNSGRSPLLICLSRNDKDNSYKLISAGCDINHQDKMGMTPLMVAVCQKNAHLVEMLLQHGAKRDLRCKSGLTVQDFAFIVQKNSIKKLLDMKLGKVKVTTSDAYSSLMGKKEALNAVVFMNKAELSMIKEFSDVVFKKECTCEHHTPLMVAAQLENIKAVQILLERGIKVNEQLENGTTALAVAVAKDHVAVFERLIEYGADLNLMDTNGQTLLFRCAAAGHLDALLKLERLGANVDKRNREGETPLMAAAMAGHVDIVRCLWKMGAQIETKNRNGYSALDLAKTYERPEVEELLQDKHDLPMLAEENELDPRLAEACFRADENEMKKLIKQGASVNFRDPKYNMRPTLSYAIRGGVLSVVKLLIQTGASVNLTGFDNRTALFNACLNGHMEIVRYLIEKGANVNLSDEDGHTPLMAACQHGHVEVVSYLVSQRALINCKDKQGISALGYAMGKGHMDVMKILLETQVAHADTVDVKNRSLLYLAVAKEKSQMVIMLLDHGADIDHQLNEKKKTPLMLAACDGNLEMVKLLVEHGASVVKLDFHHHTAHEIAERQYHTDVGAYLAEKYAEKNQLLSSSDSVLGSDKADHKPRLHEPHFSGKAEGENNLLDMCTQDWGFEDSVRFSIEAGADINCKDRDGLTPVLISMDRGHFKYIPWLIKYGADMNCQDRNGVTPLMLSLQKDLEYSMVYTILDSVADVDIQDAEGRTALMMAIQRNKFEIARQLVQQSVNINLSDNQGNTALSYSAMNQSSEVDLVRDLLLKGANFDYVNLDGDTPLLLALKYENQTAVEILLNTEVDPIHRNHLDEDAFLLACRTLRCCFVEMLAAFHDFFDPQTLDLSLRLFASNSMNENIQVLLQHGLDINRKYQNGETLTFVSVRHRNLELLDSLASHGADIDLQNDRGQTVAMLASETEDIDLMRAVLSLKPNLSLQDRQRRKAMDIALANANYTFCTLIEGMIGDTGECEACYLFCDIAEADLTNSSLSSAEPDALLDMLWMMEPQEHTWQDPGKEQHNILTGIVGYTNTDSSHHVEDCACVGINREAVTAGIQGDVRQAGESYHQLPAGERVKPAEGQRSITKNNLDIGPVTEGFSLRSRVTPEAIYSPESQGLYSEDTRSSCQEKGPATLKKMSGIPRRASENQGKGLINKQDSTYKDLLMGNHTQRTGNTRGVNSSQMGIGYNQHVLDGNKEVNNGNEVGNQGGSGSNQGGSVGNQRGLGVNQGRLDGNQRGLGGNQGRLGGNQGGSGGNQGGLGGNQGGSGGKQGGSGSNQGGSVGNQGGSGGNQGGSGGNQGGSGSNQGGSVGNQRGLGGNQGGLGGNQRGLGGNQGGSGGNQGGSGGNQGGSGGNQGGSGGNQGGSGGNQGEFGGNQGGSGGNQRGLGVNQGGSGGNQGGSGGNQGKFGGNQRRSGGNQRGLGVNQGGLGGKPGVVVGNPGVLMGDMTERYHTNVLGKWHLNGNKDKNVTENSKDVDGEMWDCGTTESNCHGRNGENPESKFASHEKKLASVKSENQTLRRQLTETEAQIKQYSFQVKELRESLRRKDHMIEALEGEIAAQKQKTHNEPCKTPEEDKYSMWQTCCCKEDTCPSCVAEKAATAAPPADKKWNYNPTWNENKQHQTESVEPPAQQYTDDTRMVDIITAESSGSYSTKDVLIYRFHMTISNSAQSDKSLKFCSSCSLASLLFAHSFQHSSCRVYTHIVTDQLFSIVTKSIAEATGIANLNLKQRTSFLSPSETLMLCSDLNLELVDEVALDTMLFETLLHYMIHIERSQILLLYRMDHYKVLSIAATQDGDRLVVFDPQWHSEEDKDGGTLWFGAYLFYSRRVVEDAKVAIQMMSRHCGNLQGHSRLAVLRINKQGT